MAFKTKVLNCFNHFYQTINNLFETVVKDEITSNTVHVPVTSGVQEGTIIVPTLF